MEAIRVHARSANGTVTALRGMESADGPQNWRIKVSQSALDRTEQFYINAYGGPTTKLFTGELSNARNQMSWLRYMLAGGG